MLCLFKDMVTFCFSPRKTSCLIHSTRELMLTYRSSSLFLCSSCLMLGPTTSSCLVQHRGVLAKWLRPSRYEFSHCSGLVLKSLPYFCRFPQLCMGTWSFEGAGGSQMWSSYVSSLCAVGYINCCALTTWAKWAGRLLLTVELPTWFKHGSEDEVGFFCGAHDNGMSNVQLLTLYLRGSALIPME